jgi:hypothetical protein
LHREKTFLERPRISVQQREERAGRRRLAQDQLAQSR